MKCGHIGCQVEIPDGLKVKGRFKLFCSPAHRKLAWMDEHVIKRKHPKRKRDRHEEFEAARLIRAIHKGETLEQLRQQALRKRESK